MTVVAYLALEAGGRSALTRFVWPLPDDDGPGRWVTAEEAGGAVRGIPLEQLPWALDEALWRLELDREVRVIDRALVGARGRILSRVERWDAEAARDLVAASAERIRSLLVDALARAGRAHDRKRLAAARGSTELERVATQLGGEGAVGLLAGFLTDVFLYARDSETASEAAGVAAYIAAHAAAGGDKMATGYGELFNAERHRQVEWLRERLQL